MTTDADTTVTAEAQKPRRRWPWILGMIGTLILGIIIGFASAGTEPTTTPETVTVTETVEVESQALLDKIAALEAELAEAQAAAEEEPAEEEPAEEVEGEYTAGAYAFNDVQISEDLLGDFAMRARVTNTGDDREYVLWTATAFHEGTVVATFDGIVDGLAAGETKTVEFISIDTYTDWDEVEFQVDTEF